jgi:hypothetical protein
MMITQAHQKIRKDHLERKAYLYVRQSTLQQVRRHQESTQRQYALQRKAEELGWPHGRIVVIDCDLGCLASEIKWNRSVRFCERLPAVLTPQRLPSPTMQDRVARTGGAPRMGP